jgi:hypothetical protein
MAGERTSIAPARSSRAPPGGAEPHLDAVQYASGAREPVGDIRGRARAGSAR